MRVERTLVGLLCIAATAMTGCGGRLAYNLPPAIRLMEPGPGVGGPGPGVIPPAGNPYGLYGGAVGRFGDGAGGYMGGGFEQCAAPNPAGQNLAGPAAADSGVVQASYNTDGGGPSGYGGGAPGYGGCGCDGGMNTGCVDGCNVDTCGYGACGCGPGAACGHGHGGLLGGRLRGLLHGHGAWRPGSTEAYAEGAMAGAPTSQIAFLGEEGVQVSWDVGGVGMFDSTPLVIPGRQDFYQGAIYRLKLTNLPGRPGVELYPTLEVAPVTPRTDAYLAHSPIPIQFTEEDFDQVLSGNFVTKVIYLPDPEFQELALAGVETLVSTRLDPGVDPIAEADRRGSILAIVRMGNKDLEPGFGASIQTEPTVVPASYVPADSSNDLHGSARSREQQAVYSQSTSDSARMVDDQVVPAQYGQPCEPAYGDAYCDGAYDGAAAGMPMGMPTSGFAPPAVPPNYIAGAPQWGMPITGTPIGLPGPPHIPLGSPAGLQRHVMKNRTRVLMPPPVTEMRMTVKQRPGMNYPRPVNHINMNETQREPFNLVPSWLSGMFHHRGHRGGGAYGDPNCQ